MRKCNRSEFNIQQKIHYLILIKVHGLISESKLFPCKSLQMLNLADLKSLSLETAEYCSVKHTSTQMSCSLSQSPMYFPAELQQQLWKIQYTSALQFTSRLSVCPWRRLMGMHEHMYRLLIEYIFSFLPDPKLSYRTSRLIHFKLCFENK